MTASTAPPAFATSPRLYVAAPLRAGVAIEATPEQAHYLRTVLRRGSGDPVRLFNGSDGEWVACVNTSGRHGASLVVEQRIRAQHPESGAWLVFALLKRDATDLVVRQAVELGASRVLPVITERTNAARVNQDRLRAIAIEAAEQSERLTVPEIDPPARIATVLAAWPPDRRLFTAIERSPPAHSILAAATARCQASALLIGPEGGFSAAEQDYFRRFAFITSISLGPTILRAETAAAAGLAQLLVVGQAEYAKAT